MARNVSGHRIRVVQIRGDQVISELKATSRAIGILIMVSVAGVSWLLFGLVPAPYSIVFLFTNGFPLGLVWGMVFGYLEGRRFTEVLGAGLSVSFIFSAGLAKSVGGFIMRDFGVSCICSINSPHPHR
jgi:hypothetical protein